MLLGKYLSQKPKNNRFYTVAIDGRGGSGKTTFAEYLKTLLPDFVFLNGDDYFEPVENQTVWGAFNDDRFQQDVIDPLKTGDTFTYRPYDFQKRQYTSSQITVDKGFVLERCYSFHFDVDWDLKIWVETPRALCLQRAIQQAHMSKERIVSAWNEVWQPQEDRYIKKNHPMKKADVIIYGDKPFKDQVTL